MKKLWLQSLIFLHLHLSTHIDYYNTEKIWNSNNSMHYNKVSLSLVREGHQHCQEKVDQPRYGY